MATSRPPSASRGTCRRAPPFRCLMRRAGARTWRLCRRARAAAATRPTRYAVARSTRTAPGDRPAVSRPSIARRPSAGAPTRPPTPSGPERRQTRAHPGSDGAGSAPSDGAAGAAALDVSAPALGGAAGGPHRTRVLARLAERPAQRTTRPRSNAARRASATPRSVRWGVGPARRPAPRVAPAPLGSSSAS
jgi:hypothetical protein